MYAGENTAYLCYLVNAVSCHCSPGQVLKEGTRDWTDKVKVEAAVELCSTVLTNLVDVFTSWTNEVDSHCILDLLSRGVYQTVE